MNALQIQTGERFVNAMGSLIADEYSVNRVLNYIISLHEPCQYSEEELRMRIAAATEDAYLGKGTTIADIKKEVATW